MTQSRVAMMAQSLTATYRTIIKHTLCLYILVVYISSLNSGQSVGVPTVL